MNQYDTILALLGWIESNLTKRLTIERVSDKSGYTKFHLQRMFKSVTGRSICAYIRGRQLSMAAMELRMTKRPIIDIAAAWHFDSQQSFTRAFKKQFGYTPARYRKSDDWELEGMEIPLYLVSVDVAACTSK
nr:AraC family transcriptional regulator [Pantoea cypripedii]